MSADRPRRQGRRGSAVGLLNVDDEAVYGDNANKYGKKKGSLLSRVKKNVGQKIEAAKTTKLSINDGVQMLVSKSGHYSAEKEPDSDEWESDDDFESNVSFDADSGNPKSQNSSFDQSFDFPNAFGENDGQSKKHDVSQQTFVDDDGSEQFVVRSTVKSLGIKARSKEGSKAKAERRRSNSLGRNEVSQEKRRSNDSLLSRRLEDQNLTKIKYGDDPSIIQFSPWMQPSADPKSEPFSVASSEKQTKEVDPFSSKSEQLALDADDPRAKKKKDKTRKKVRRTNSMPSEKVMRRAQRRSVESGQPTDDQNVGRSTRNPRRHRRTKSTDDAPLDVSDLIDVGALVDSMKDEKKTKKKRTARSPKRRNNSSSHSRPLSTSGHSRGLNTSSHHSRGLNTSSHRKSKGETRSSTTPAEIIQPSSLDVRF